MTDQQKLKVYQRLLDVVEACVLVVDRDGKIVDLNENYYRTMLLSKVKKREEIIGLPVNQIFTNSVLPGLMEKNEPAQINMDLFTSGPEFSLVYTEKDIAIRTCANVLDDDGSVIGAFAMVRTYSQIMELCDRLMDERRELKYYKKQLRKLTSGIATYDEIIGTSEEIQKTKMEMVRAAATDFSIVIEGETGTGKELFANAIYRNSRRKDYPFVRVNCSAIPKELFESELFGYAEGAFTGAKKGGKPGRFELANGGTLFLDEIGDMPIEMQAKLLRVLQEQEVDRVGGTKPVKIDVRIIAATNRDLVQRVREKKFRADLYYRLNVISIRIPPLRERKIDIPELAEFFLDGLNKKYGTRVFFSADALLEMQNYEWPGNVRELRNKVERMYAFRTGSCLKSLETEEEYAESAPSSEGTDAAGSAETIVPLPKQIEEFEKKVIETRLRINHFNFLKTARELGINRGTLYNKVRKYGITEDGEDASFGENQNGADAKDAGKP